MTTEQRRKRILAKVDFEQALFMMTVCFSSLKVTPEREEGLRRLREVVYWWGEAQSADQSPEVEP